MKTLATQGIEPNGGALNSKVSKLVEFCHCEERSDVAIAKSLDIDEITTSHFTNAPRNDRDGHLERSERSQSYEILRLAPQNDSNFTLALWGRGQGEGLTNQIADAPRNDIKPTHPNLPLKREGTVRHPELVSGSQNETFFSRFTSLFSRKRVAFTLAEVLITLGIIGVVVAMTMPTLINQYRKKALETQFKSAYSLMNQAIVMTKQDLGSNSLYDDYTVLVTGQGFVNKDEFVNAFYKMVRVVGNATLKSSDYSIYSDGKIKRYADNKDFSFATPKKLLQNGMTILADVNGTLDGKHIKIVIDINGTKGPNRMGHDLFEFKIKDSSDKLIGSKQLRLYTDEELGDLSSGGINNLRGMPCSRYSKQSANGIGCTWYAINDICPDDDTKGYWECLPK